MYGSARGLLQRRPRLCLTERPLVWIPSWTDWSEGEALMQPTCGSLAWQSVLQWWAAEDDGFPLAASEEVYEECALFLLTLLSACFLTATLLVSTCVNPCHVQSCCCRNNHLTVCKLHTVRNTAAKWLRNMLFSWALCGRHCTTNSVVNNTTNCHLKKQLITPGGLYLSLKCC